MKFPPFTDNSQSGEILSILTAGGTLKYGRYSLIKGGSHE